MVLEALEPIAAAMSPSSIVLIGFALTVLYILYQSAPEIFDIYIDISNGDYQLFDGNVMIFNQFTWHEVFLVALSLYYQYAVVTPKTGIQSVLKNATYIILFTVFVNFVVRKYFLEANDN